MVRRTLKKASEVDGLAVLRAYNLSDRTVKNIREEFGISSQRLYEVLDDLHYSGFEVKYRTNRTPNKPIVREDPKKVVSVTKMESHVLSYMGGFAKVAVLAGAVLGSFTNYVSNSNFIEVGSRGSYVQVDNAKEEILSLSGDREELEIGRNLEEKVASSDNVVNVNAVDDVVDYDLVDFSKVPEAPRSVSRTSKNIDYVVQTTISGINVMQRMGRTYNSIRESVSRSLGKVKKGFSLRARNFDDSGFEKIDYEQERTLSDIDILDTNNVNGLFARHVHKYSELVLSGKIGLAKEYKREVIDKVTGMNWTAEDRLKGRQRVMQDAFELVVNELKGKNTDKKRLLHELNILFNAHNNQLIEQSSDFMNGLKMDELNKGQNMATNNLLFKFMAAQIIADAYSN